MSTPAQRHATRPRLHAAGPPLPACRAPASRIAPSKCK